MAKLFSIYPAKKPHAGNSANWVWQKFSAFLLGRENASHPPIFQIAFAFPMHMVKKIND